MKKLNLIHIISLIAGHLFLFSCKKDQQQSSTPTNAIVSSDYFTIGVSKYVPVSKSTYTRNGNWIVDSHYKSTPPYSQLTADLVIYFHATSRISSSGTYLLQSDSTKLTAGQVYIQFNDNSALDSGCGCANSDNGFSTSGQLTISVADNGQVHIIFNNINAIDNSTHFDELHGYSKNISTIKNSGDITCY